MRRGAAAWLLSATRAGYGAALVAAPAALIRCTGNPAPGPRERAVARVLGARHLLQAGLTVLAGQAGADGPGVLGAGAATDLLHAASMVALGAVDGRVRQTALTDAAVEMGFAVGGTWAAASQ